MNEPKFVVPPVENTAPATKFAPDEVAEQLWRACAALSTASEMLRASVDTFALGQFTSIDNATSEIRKWWEEIHSLKHKAHCKLIQAQHPVTFEQRPTAMVVESSGSVPIGALALSRILDDIESNSKHTYPFR